RRLARAVRTEQAHDFSGVDAHGDVVHHPSAPVALDQALGLQHTGRTAVVHGVRTFAPVAGSAFATGAAGGCVSLSLLSFGWITALTRWLAPRSRPLRFSARKTVTRSPAPSFAPSCSTGDSVSTKVRNV